MRKRLILIIALIVTSAATTTAQTIINHASITFKIKNLGIYTNGTIGGLRADVHFNPADPASGSIAASVEVSTLNTDNSDRDTHLKSEDFFDLAHYPQITLKSISFKHKSGNNYTGMFNLNIKGRTKQIEIPFTYADKGNAVYFNSSFKLNRLDFGVGSKSLLMSDEVMVTIDAEAAK